MATVRRCRHRNRCHERCVDGAHGGVPHIDRERDRLSDASMCQPGCPGVEIVVRESCGGMMTIIDTTSDTVTSQFVEEDINRPTGKLTDCQAPFRRRSTAGLSSSASRSASVAVVAISRFPHGNIFRIVVGLIRFSGRFPRADRSSSSVLLSVNERTGVGPVRNRVLSGFAQDPRPLPSRVVQRNVHVRTTALDKDGDNACQRQSSAPSNGAYEAASAEDRCGGATDLRPKTA
jgi:hypothetical protein